MDNESNKIKICYITHESNLTGASQSLLDILDALDEEKVEPLVLLRKNGPLEEELEVRGVNYKVVYYTQSIKEAERSNPVRNLIKRSINAMQEFRIARLLKNEKIDIVHNNSIFAISGMKAAKKAGIPYICHIREVLFDEHILRPISIKALRKCMDGAAKTIAISAYVYSKYEEYLNIKECEIIFDGIDTRKYYHTHEVLFKDDLVKILMAGRLEKAKGQIDAIRAIETLNKRGYNNIELFIVGGDAPNTSYPKKIREYVYKKKLNNIHFLGFQDLKELRSKCDICVLCSTNEALGRVTVESMLAGCLVIGADACATPEIIEDGSTGLLYDAGNSESLADCIEKVLLKKYNAIKIAEQGQKYALSFDMKKYMEYFEKLYSTLTKHNNAKT